MTANLRLYPWFIFFRNLLFWQAIWFLYFQTELSAAEAILLYAVYDIATTVLEVPSGYLSDRLGRRITLILSALASMFGVALLAIGGAFHVFVAGQILLGAGAALSSGTDSALLYESLDRDGMADEVEHREVTAWRYSFTALALSAVAGGGMAMAETTLPFLASALAAAIAVGIAFRFREPSRPEALTDSPRQTQLQAMLRAFRTPVLAWLFVLTLMMYVFSHVPFVFGQPFIQEALDATGLGQDAPLVSGVVTSLMMLVSVGTSWLAPVLRRALGLATMLLAAFAVQIALSGVLAISNDVLVISVLLLRMVPDSLSRPFIIARIQPLLPDQSRATYLSMQSFFGRLLLSLTLIGFSYRTSAEAALSYPEIREILIWYVAAGIVILTGLAVTARHARLSA